MAIGHRPRQGAPILSRNGEVNGNPLCSISSPFRCSGEECNTLARVDAGVKEWPLFAMCRCVRVPARNATKAELETVHTPSHVESMSTLTALTPLARAELSSTFSSM